jgi:hypothetical protein
MKIQVEVFWIVTPCSVVVGYQLPPYSRRHNPEDIDLSHDWSLPLNIIYGLYNSVRSDDGDDNNSILNKRFSERDTFCYLSKPVETVKWNFNTPCGYNFHM